MLAAPVGQGARSPGFTSKKATQMAARGGSLFITEANKALVQRRSKTLS